MPDLPVTGPFIRPDGLTVLRRDDPVLVARALARELGGTVAIGGPAVRDAVEHRLRSQHLGIAATPPTIDLDRLGDAMRRAEVVLERTRAQVSAGLARSLNSALAIHPDTIRRAAADVIAADHALRRARAGNPPGSARGRITATVVAIAGIAVGAMLAVSGAPGRGLALAISSTALALAATAALRRHHQTLIPHWANGAELARRRWQQLAGRDVEPDELDRVLQRYDPQRETVGDLASCHPAVRAAERAVADRRRAWVRGWRLSVGDLVDDDAPTIEPRRPLVIGDLYSGLDAAGARRLHHDLRGLGGDAGVVVVLRPAGDVIDLRERVDELDALAPGGPGVEMQHA